MHDSSTWRNNDSMTGQPLNYHLLQQKLINTENNFFKRLYPLL